MAKKNKSQQLAVKWKDRLRRAEKIQEPLRKQSIRFKKSYMGSDRMSSKGSRHALFDRSNGSIKVNFIFAFIEIILPAILSGMPKISAKAKREEFVERAKLYAENINYWLTELDSKEEFEDALFDSFFGPAAVEVGWTYIDTILKDPKTGKEFTKVIKDQPFLNWIDFWNDIRIDPDVKRQRQARWIAKRNVVTFDDFQSINNIDKRFKKGGARELRAEMRPEDVESNNDHQNRSVSDNHRGSNKSDEEWIEFWEIWDKQSMKKVLVSMQSNEVLSEEPWPYYLEVRDDPFPITIFSAKKDPFGPYSFSEFQAYEQQIEETVDNEHLFQ